MTGVPEAVGLFDVEAPPPVTLADRFVVPPLSVLDRRSGLWQERKRRWLSLGIRSEVGRDADVYTGVRPNYAGEKASGSIPSLSTPMPEASAGTAAAGGLQSGRGRRAVQAGLSSAMAALHGEGTADAARRREGLTLGPPSGYRPDYYHLKERAEEQEGRPLTHTEFVEHHLPAAEGAATLSNAGTSIFDPVLCELVYRWFCPRDGHVLDPFAGGSVRGVVASRLHRCYTGVDLRPEQVEANEGQRGLALDTHPPVWVTGDSARLADLVDPGPYDLVFSCPPYGDLEVYSDDPADLSAMSANDFDATHAAIIGAAADMLAADRYACWVISDVRDRRGHYRSLVSDTIRAFQDAGLHYLNDLVTVDPVGSGAVRAAKQFNVSRRLVRTHQHLLVFVKGDTRAAAARIGGAV